MVEKKYIPNLLTTSRILLSPVFLYCLFADFNHSNLIALTVFVIASITDGIDGFYARKHNFVSKLGIFLDPLADKLLVLSAFYGFLFIPHLDAVVKLWMIILISFRDVLVTALRLLMEMKGITMVTSKAGKLKTSLQLTTIIVIMISLIIPSYNFQIWDFIYDISFLYGAMVLTTLVTFYTGIHYFFFNYKKLRQLLFQK